MLRGRVANQVRAHTLVDSWTKSILLLRRLVTDAVNPLLLVTPEPGGRYALDVLRLRERYRRYVLEHVSQLVVAVRSGLR